MALHEETFTIRTAETTADGHARLATLCHLLQEAAGNHAADLGFGMGALRKEGRAWMLHRLQLRVRRYPRRGEQVRVRTWPSGGDGLRAWRDFRVFGEGDEPVALSLSHWLLIDLERRRPVRMPEEIMRLAEASPEERHVLPLTGDKLPACPAGGPGSLDFRVRHGDLDLNDHVNNVRYLEWMLEALRPEETLHGRQPVETDVEFHAECRYGERVEALAGPADEGNGDGDAAGKRRGRLAELRRQQDGRLVARALFAFPG